MAAEILHSPGDDPVDGWETPTLDVELEDRPIVSVVAAIALVIIAASVALAAFAYVVSTL